MDRYETFAKLKELTEMKTIENNDKVLSFSKMCQTGNLEFCDYGRGFLNVEISAYVHPSKGHGPFCRVWFATIDDGDFGGWVNHKTLEDARKQAIKVKEVFEKIVTLPTQDELNILLRPTGMYVCNE